MIEKSQLFFKHCRVFLSVHLSIGTFPLLLTWCIQTGWHFFPWNITQPSAAINGYIFRRLWDTDCRTLENLPGRSKGFEITTAIKQPTFRSPIGGTKVHEKKKHCILQQEPFSDQTSVWIYMTWIYMQMHWALLTSAGSKAEGAVHTVGRDRTTALGCVGLATTMRLGGRLQCFLVES